MKILLPVDGSAYTKRMLSCIAAHDELLGARHEYMFFTVVTPLPVHAARHLDRAMIEQYVHEVSEEVLRPVRAFAAQQGWTFRDAHVLGHAAEAIATMADSMRADLIVMGSHGHSNFGNVVLGSVATGVLSRCRAPVLLVR